MRNALTACGLLHKNLVASCTPLGMPSRGPRTADGSELAQQSRDAFTPVARLEMLDRIIDGDNAEYVAGFVKHR